MIGELLVEIGTEEIPARFMPRAVEAFKELMQRQLQENRIEVETVHTCGTPRRLVLTATGIAPMQKDIVIQKTGPAKSAAFDSEGKPTKAAIGFAKGQGVAVSELKCIQTEKGDYVSAERKEAGKPTETLLPDIIPAVISSLSFPKSMRWHDYDLRYARPIHWILAVFNGKTVPFSLEEVTSGNTTRGHRFMAPGEQTVDTIAAYFSAMENAGVVVDQQKRQTLMTAQIHRLAQDAGGITDDDPDLIQEVVWLVEHPYAVLCSFDTDFLNLPKELLVLTMKKHQRYFPVFSKDGKPLRYFIAVNNTDVVNPEVVVKGHERVLRARLSDAAFFFKEDQKKSLDSMTAALKQVVFQAKLGTSYEKVSRFRALALFIAETLGLEDLSKGIDRAAYLCKADLVSGMVGEFPELQGVMGREYARIAGEDREVCEAIFEHYLPRFSGDRLPETDTGAVVSIADKLDTITGCFGIGLVPTGAADPYALRRQALGIINIILNRRYPLSLNACIQQSIRLLSEKITKTQTEMFNDVVLFFSGRFSNMLTLRGISHDAVDAVVSRGIDDLTDACDRIESLNRMKKDPDFEALSVSFKRVVNILEGQTFGAVDTARFVDENEKLLYDKYIDIYDAVIDHMTGRHYDNALKLISTMKPEVDAFFDNVLVMAQEETLRKNRLSLLYEISKLFTDFADFSKITTEKIS